MDLVYVDKLAKDNNSVKYLLVRQDLFDRTPDAKGMKTKNSKETVRLFLTTVTKKNQPEKNGWTGAQNLLESLKNLAKLKGYNFNLHSMRLRLHLRNLQNEIPEIYTLPLLGRQ